MNFKKRKTAKDFLFSFLKRYKKRGKRNLSIALIYQCTHICYTYISTLLSELEKEGKIIKRKKGRCLDIEILEKK